MTRKEYMKELEIKLSFLPEKTKEAALMFCEEMLDDRMEDGMDEESAVAAMESPQQLADRLLAEAGDNIDTGKLRLPSRDEFLQFARLSDEALEGVDKVLKDADKARPQPEQEAKPEPEPPKQPESQPAPEAPRTEPDMDFPDVGKIVREAMEMARKGIEIGQQAARESMKAAQQSMKDAQQTVQSATADCGYQIKTLNCSADALTAAKIVCLNMPVAVRPSPDGQARLTYYTSPEEPYEARVENGVLVLENPMQGKGFSLNRLGSMFGSGFKFLMTRSQPTVELLLPPQTLLDLSVRTTNGSVKLGGMEALCRVDATTTNGRIEVRDVRCKSLELKSSNGRLVLERVEVKRFLTGVTSNGRIEARGVRAGEETTLKSSNGSLHLTDIVCGAAFSGVSSNGHIEVENVSAAALTLRTSNSSIRGTLPGSLSDYAVDSGTSNGSNSLPKHQAGMKPLSVHTSNSSIRIQFER